MFLFIATAWADNIQEIAKPAESFSVFRIIWNADPVVKLTLLVLVMASVACWAIIFYKRRQLKNAGILGDRFNDAFVRSRNLEELLVRTPGSLSPMGGIFRTAMKEIAGKGSAKPTEAILKRRIDRAAQEEINELEHYVPFLATTGSTAPFVGLFGTVWGILAAFWKIGSAGSSSLAVVGPHLAEALIATAVGLATAIPAVIAYNIFVGKIRFLVLEINEFAMELHSRLKQESL